MHISDLLNQWKNIGRPTCTLEEVIVRTGKVYGDMCRWERNAPKDVKTHTDQDLMKELGNVIFCFIRRADDLGYVPEECIGLAINCQENFHETSPQKGIGYEMTVESLLQKARSLWREKNTLGQILVRMGKVFGDICRRERNYAKDTAIHTDEELMKEFGNMIFSTVKRCDDLGYVPEECIALAVECQVNFEK